MSSRVHPGSRRKTTGRVTPSKLRRTAVIAVDSVLAVGTGAVAGLFATSTLPAGASTSGWAATQAPLPSTPDAPATNPDVTIDQESCPTAVSCVAAGNYSDPSHSHGLLDVQSGGTWTVTEAPVPSDAANDRQSTLGSVRVPTSNSV